MAIVKSRNTENRVCDVKLINTNGCDYISLSVSLSYYVR